ncbi:MAG: pentapeptide repeat-containing protein [Rhodobacteraceae bacterium]|nr:pentapeptide repeat-containing protein [Paracoccaceae bacterium]
MDPQSDDQAKIGSRAVQAGVFGPWLGILVFGFGLAAGILIAFSGFAFLEDSAGVVVLVFLSALAVVAILGSVLFVARKPILRVVFGHAQTEIERLAVPLAEMAERAIERDPTGATRAARDVVSLGLARYAWITARRWVIASLTALIAAMAALAGTALLFKQNQLIAAQSDLLRDQNSRIEEQTVLLTQQVQLAEAERNAALSVEITGIAARLGSALDRIDPVRPGSGGEIQLFNALDPAELDRELILRVTSISRATQPYRFLDLGVRAQDFGDKLRHAMDRRRADLPATYARMADAFQWAEESEESRLIDRPLSPERGQLLTVLMGAGIHNLEPLNFAGLDLSFAHMPNADITVLTGLGARLSYADFSGSYLTEVDLGGASLENVRFRGAQIRRSTFAVVGPDRTHPPFLPENGPYSTFLSGADFNRSVQFGTDFTGAYLTAASFDDAVLVAPNFTDAALGASTFRRAVIIGANFSGADLKSCDFDGAILFGTDVLAELEGAAFPESFIASRYEVEAVPIADVMQLNGVYQNLEQSQIETAAPGAGAFRLRRIQSFEN